MELKQKLPNWELLPIFDTAVPNLEHFKGKPLLILFFNLGCSCRESRVLSYANNVFIENGRVVK